MTCIVLLLLLSYMYGVCIVCVYFVFIICWYGYMLFNIHLDRIDWLTAQMHNPKNFNTDDNDDDDDDDVWKLRLGSVNKIFYFFFFFFLFFFFLGRAVNVSSRNCESVLLVYYFFFFFFKLHKQAIKKFFLSFVYLIRCTDDRCEWQWQTFSLSFLFLMPLSLSSTIFRADTISIETDQFWNYLKWKKNYSKIFDKLRFTLSAFV